MINGGKEIEQCVAVLNKNLSKICLIYFNAIV